MGEERTIHTAFWLSATGDNAAYKATHNSRIWVGNDGTYLSTALTLVTDYFFDGGFKPLINLVKGRYVAFRREGNGIYYKYAANEIKLYEVPNLLALGGASISDHPISSSNTADNLLTNIENRAARSSWRAIIDASGNTINSSSCMTAYLNSDAEFVLGIDLG